MLVVIVLLKKFVDTAVCVILINSTFSIENPSEISEKNMEANKENILKKVKTRIPLPVEPLPPLPNHLLLKNVENGIIKKRVPLKTLVRTNVLPSSSKCKQKKSVTKSKWEIKIDTKHVTVRKEKEELDWNYKVFKDHDGSIISISDDEDKEKDCKEGTFFDVNKKRNCLGEHLAITPSERSPRQHKALRNIKRSLKRPHSRELQGLSPTCKLEKKEGDKAKRRLEFSESINMCNTPDFLKRSYTSCMNRDYTDNMLEYLMEVERKPLAGPTIPSITRACVINWLMKVNGPFGKPAVIQSACWYLDSVLGLGDIQLNKLQLIAAACYWIAKKLHGPVVPASRLVKCANNAFSQARLLATEKAVLMTLGFPLQPVTPDEYITYLAWWCNSAHPREIEVAANFLCMTGLMVMKELCEEYPSVIAAAAVRNAVLLLKKEEMMKHLQQCPMFKAAAKKATNLSHTCALMRRSVRTLADMHYEYKTPMEHYGVPPHYIAQQIINATCQ